MRLDLWLESRLWWRREEPFPHVVAHNVFRPAVYEEFEKSFNEVMSRGLTDDANDATRFSRSMSGYDAFGYRLARGTGKPFSFFASREWHDLIASLFNVNSTGDVEMTLHHHGVGSTTGWLHNDLNPAWFVDQADSDGINLSDPNVCEYHFGAAKKEGVTPVERIRAIALLFYLANPPWRPGDGGETGVYKLKNAPPDAPYIAIPPINNSMVAFECTPYSYHTFIGNRRSPRNCLIMWLHRAKRDVIARWGEKSIKQWR